MCRFFTLHRMTGRQSSVRKTRYDLLWGLGGVEDRECGFKHSCVGLTWGEAWSGKGLCGVSLQWKPAGTVCLSKTWPLTHVVCHVPSVEAAMSPSTFRGDRTFTSSRMYISSGRRSSLRSPFCSSLSCPHTYPGEQQSEYRLPTPSVWAHKTIKQAWKSNIYW